jgi:outer membrane lipopolysaccharide assembly protein LptE/RlpB
MIQVIMMQVAIRKRTALAACGFALCGALAAPAAMEVAATVADSGQVQTEAERKKPKKPKKVKSIQAEELAVRPVVVVKG